MYSGSLFSGEILVSGLHEALVSAPIRLHVHVFPGSIYQMNKNGLERTISLVGVEVSLTSINDYSVSVLGAPGLSKDLVLTPCGEAIDKLRLFAAVKSAALLSPSLSGLCLSLVGGVSKLSDSGYKNTAILLSSNKQRLVLCLRQSIERLGQVINTADADNTIVKSLEFVASPDISEEERNEYEGEASGATLITALAQNSILGRRADSCNVRRLRAASKRRALLKSELLYQEEHQLATNERNTLKLDAYRAKVVAAASLKMSIALERCCWMCFTSPGYNEGSRQPGTSISSSLFSAPLTMYLKVRDASIMGSGNGGHRILGVRQMFRSSVAKTQSFWLSGVSLQPCGAGGGGKTSKAGGGGKSAKIEKEGIEEEREEVALSSSSLFLSGLVGARLGQSELSRAFRNIRKYMMNEWVDYVIASVCRCQQAVRQWIKKKRGEKVIINNTIIETVGGYSTVTEIELKNVEVTNAIAVDKAAAPVSISALSPSRSDRIAALKGL